MSRAPFAPSPSPAALTASCKERCSLSVSVYPERGDADMDEASQRARWRLPVFDLVAITTSGELRNRKVGRRPSVAGVASLLHLTLPQPA